LFSCAKLQFLFFDHAMTSSVVMDLSVRDCSIPSPLPSLEGGPSRRRTAVRILRCFIYTIRIVSKRTVSWILAGTAIRFCWHWTGVSDHPAALHATGLRYRRYYRM